MLLTLARIWATLGTGTIMTKDAAADWVLARLEPGLRPVLEHARGLYRSTTYADEPPWCDDLLAQVRPHVDEVLAQIRRLSPSDDPAPTTR